VEVVVDYHSNATTEALSSEGILAKVLIERPSLMFGEGDFGWFCREHALHLYGVAKLLGKDVAICVGDILVHRPPGASYRSVGVPNGHAWCCIDEMVPVDVSLTLKYIYRDLPDVKLIYGERRDLFAPFHLRYMVNESNKMFQRLATTDDLLIGYNEKHRYYFDLLKLLAHPFQFLHKPPPGMLTFPQLHGADIFFAITYHCYRLLTEDMKPLFSYCDPRRTVRRIMQLNSDAKQRIEQLLA